LCIRVCGFFPDICLPVAHLHTQPPVLFILIGSYSTFHYTVWFPLRLHFALVVLHYPHLRHTVANGTRGCVYDVAVVHCIGLFLHAYTRFTFAGLHCSLQQYATLHCLRCCTRLHGRYPAPCYRTFVVVGCTFYLPGSVLYRFTTFLPYSTRFAHAFPVAHTHARFIHSPYLPLYGCITYRCSSWLG